MVDELERANERIAELEEKSDLMMTKLMVSGLALASGKECPVAIETLNKFAIEKKIEALDEIAYQLRFHIKGEITSDTIDKFIGAKIEQLHKEKGLLDTVTICN